MIKIKLPYNPEIEIYWRGKVGEETVCYTTLPTEIGVVVVAADRYGICRLEFLEGDTNPDDLLRRVFPKAILEESDSGNFKYVEDYLGGVSHGEIALSISATPFQRLVWEHLLSIPLGDTVTYQDIASLIGNPLASRAVGAAVGANPVSLIIPCHRVIRRDGLPGGYRWGLTRKLNLLASEKTKT